MQEFTYIIPKNILDTYGITREQIEAEFGGKCLVFDTQKYFDELEKTYSKQQDMVKYNIHGH